MTNKARGEVPVEIDGQNYVFRLSMGALAEIETATGSSSLAEIGERLASASTDHIMGVVMALSKAGGTPIQKSVIEDWPLSALAPIQDGITQAFALAGMTGEDAKETSDAPKPKPRSRGKSGSQRAFAQEKQAA